MVDNAVYTPSPKMVAVVQFDVGDGRTVCVVDEPDAERMVAAQNGMATLLRREVATVVVRGNLAKSGNYRWHTVQFADGSRDSVLVEGS